jgi:hypothetical protein
MRRLLVVFLLLSMAVAIYVLYPRSRLPAPESVAQETPSPLLVPVSPRVPGRSAATPGTSDARPDVRVPVPDEAALMRQLRENVRSNPQLAESLAREGRQRFPASVDSDERDALLVDALINQQRIGAARSETYYYFDHHPTGRFAEHLFVMTGVHPTPKGPN